MESLRWILLAAGIAFILVLYVLGRSRKRRNQSMHDEFEDDLPEFSATNLDDVDEGVGAVRIISGTDVDMDDVASGDNQSDVFDNSSADNVIIEDDSAKDMSTC